MSIILAKELSQHSYILSGKKSFFYRYCDTGFKTKWTGLWQGSKKFLEYFAFKINDKWLSPSSCHAFELSEIDASHHFSVDNLNIKEFLLVPEFFPSLICLLSVQNSSNEQEKVKLELEVAANIREREENWHDREYEAKTREKKVIINSPKGSIVFGSSPPGDLLLKQYYKDHHPSGEEQRCFIPGIYSLGFALEPRSTKEVLFIFSLGKDENEAFSNLEKIKSSIFSMFLEKERSYQKLLFNSRLETSMNEINELFKWSVVDLEKLSFDSELGYGYFAGFPWFTQFWGRDLAWTIPAVVDTGNFEAARNSLKTLAKFQSNEGEIPNVVYLSGHRDYESIDATPLWIIALYHYLINSGDVSFLKEIKENFFKALDWLKQKDSDKDGFIEHGDRETWMDTLDRGIKAVEAQAFLITALKLGASLVKILWNNGREIKEEAARIEQKFEKEFWNKEDNFYFDRISLNSRDKTKTINSIFPLILGISQNPKKVLERIESEEFTSQFGVRAISKNELKYDPAGYHTGSAWGWLTALVACAEFKNKRPERGLEYLKILYNNLNQNCVGAIGEAWNSENNDVMLSKEFCQEPGACLQAWSSALIVRCIDEFMLGMRINALNGTITLSPSLPSGFRVIRRKRIGNDFVDFLIQRIGSKLNVKYNSENQREYRIVLSPNF